MIKEFEAVRQWKEIRGIGGDIDVSKYINDPEKLKKFLQAQMQFQRVTQECNEIHEALVLDDEEEFIDAVGDTIVTLINIADIKGYNAEDCLEKAFNIIRLRKGLTRDSGDFVRYGKLSKEDQLICDEKQGNAGDQYFTEDALSLLTPDSFKK